MAILKPMQVGDEIDSRKIFREMKSYGPAWDAAIEFGIDMALIEESLKRSYAERYLEAVGLTELANKMALWQKNLEQ
jgi:hypothetical protein